MLTGAGAACAGALAASMLACACAVAPQGLSRPRIFRLGGVDARLSLGPTPAGAMAASGGDGAGVDAGGLESVAGGAAAVASPPAAVDGAAGFSRAAPAPPAGALTVKAHASVVLRVDGEWATARVVRLRP